MYKDASNTKIETLSQYEINHKLRSLRVVTIHPYLFLGIGLGAEVVAGFADAHRYFLFWLYIILL